MKQSESFRVQLFVLSKCSEQLRCLAIPLETRSKDHLSDLRRELLEAKHLSLGKSISRSWCGHCCASEKKQLWFCVLEKELEVGGNYQVDVGSVVD